MTQFVIDALMKLIVKHKLDTSDLTIGVFGIAYKEDVPDIRNSLSLKLIKELYLYGLKCCIYDPLVSKTQHKIRRF